MDEVEGAVTRLRVSIQTIFNPHSLRWAIALGRLATITIMGTKKSKAYSNVNVEQINGMHDQAN